jgi:two-component system response regulator
VTAATDLPASVRPIRILLVEDNPGDVVLTREGLRDGRIRNDLYVAETGEEALDFLYQRGVFREAPRPDLVFLDLNLPRVPGTEVLTRLKQDPHLRSIPVVILTSSKAEEDIYQAYANYASSYVTKPVGLEQFLLAVRSIKDFWLQVVKLPEKKP